MYFKGKNITTDYGATYKENSKIAKEKAKTLI